MFAALSWVPRGAAKAKLPERVDDTDDMELADPTLDVADSKPTTNSDSDGEAVDIGEVLANDLNALTFHKRNEKDPNLAADPNANNLFDEDEMDDLVIRPTDALIVAAKSSDDVSTLEVHLFDDDPDASDNEDGPYEPHTYVHHDIVLPILPLCTAYTRLNYGRELLNLVAVGMFTPGIDIWDVDRVNHLEPVISLGGYEKREKLTGSTGAAAAARNRNKGRRKKKPKLRLKEDSHRDAVMCLSWNNVQKEYLASGSADTTVKVWDVESAHCACTLQVHTGKVQSVAFHPTSAERLATGSFDRTVTVLDVRAPGEKLSWATEADVEQCQWGQGPSSELVFVTTEDGYMTVFDARKPVKGDLARYVSRWKVHEGAATSFSISQQIPGLMISGGVDKVVKVWDVSSVSDGRAAELIYERPSQAGSLFTLSLCPIPDTDSNASPFVVAFAGAQGTLRVCDLGVESGDVRNRFLQHSSSASSTAILRRAARQKIEKNSRAPSMASEDSDEGSGSDEEEGWVSE
eukprot:GFKZ01002706.1.p1 GENE.GFKZ01002706.1~~GFKZ01002706.1.p1  ORF type:complete len:519 (-),score=73.29 GFKZ01002706.1:388-1944(-)